MVFLCFGLALETFKRWRNSQVQVATESVDLKVEQQVGGSYGFDKDYTWIFMWISWGISSGYSGLVGTMNHHPNWRSHIFRVAQPPTSWKQKVASVPPYNCIWLPKFSYKMNIDSHFLGINQFNAHWIDALPHVLPTTDVMLGEHHRGRHRVVQREFRGEFWGNLKQQRPGITIHQRKERDTKTYKN